jgi:low temperature requirement protein LtrA
MKRIFLASKNLVSPVEQGADFVELFFDLVFVYAVTRITAFSAHNLDTFHILQAMLIFWLIWWGWTQFSWSLNAANTRMAEVRMMVLIATGVAFVMASSVGEAFGTGVMWFALPYVIIRTIGLVLYTRVIPNIKGTRARVFAFTIPSIVGLIAVMAGAIADPSQRIWWWLSAIAFDILAGYLGGRAEGWDLNPGHFAERHGLIVIIALGESLIVAATAVGSQERSQELIIAGGLAVLVTCLLWWSYFSWIKEHLEEHLSRESGRKQASLARDAYSILHFPLLCGIIGMAVGFEKIMGHPQDLLSIPVAIALCGGYVFFIGCTALSVWRLSKLLLLPRMIILIISAIGVGISVGQPPYIALIIIAISLSLLIIIEWKRCHLK